MNIKDCIQQIYNKKVIFEDEKEQNKLSKSAYSLLYIIIYFCLFIIIIYSFSSFFFLLIIIYLFLSIYFIVDSVVII